MRFLVPLPPRPIYLGTIFKNTQPMDDYKDPHPDPLEEKSGGLGSSSSLRRRPVASIRSGGTALPPSNQSIRSFCFLGRCRTRRRATALCLFRCRIGRDDPVQLNRAATERAAEPIARRPSSLGADSFDACAGSAQRRRRAQIGFDHEPDGPDRRCAAQQCPGDSSNAPAVNVVMGHFRPIRPVFQPFDVGFAPQADPRLGEKQIATTRSASARIFYRACNLVGGLFNKIK